MVTFTCVTNHQTQVVNVSTTFMKWFLILLILCLPSVLRKESFGSIIWWCHNHDHMERVLMVPYWNPKSSDEAFEAVFHGKYHRRLVFYFERKHLHLKRVINFILRRVVVLNKANFFIKYKKIIGKLKIK